MPTELHCQLVVEGPRSALTSFREDANVWDVQPWRDYFALHVDDESDNRHVYRYVEDFKRPAPSTKAQSAAHPALVFTLEYCDEFASKAGRVRYKSGKLLGSWTLHPSSLTWMEWEDE